MYVLWIMPSCLTTVLMCQEHQKAWALNLNGFDVEEAKILRLSGKPQNAPEGKTLSSWFMEGGDSSSPGLKGDTGLQFPSKTEGGGGQEAPICPSRLGAGEGVSYPSVQTHSVATGYQNRLKVLYSQKATPGSSRKTCRYIPSLPDRILDAPEIRNDYCKPCLVEREDRPGDQQT